MPKKQARNGFSFFMKELKPQLKREGRVFPNGMQDVAPIAHPRWKALPESEKKRYETIAKEYKAKMRGAEGDKYRSDTFGNLLSERVDARTELEKKRKKDRTAAKATWPAGKELADIPFYFIRFQTLCKTEEGDYLPAEIGAIEYSLKRGITKKLHRFIQPGRIPTGYRYMCKQKSEDEHQIPLDNFDKADNNFIGLWIQLENFVNPSGEKPEYPPFYCLSDDFEETEYCLTWIYERAQAGMPNRLKKLYALEDLMVDMLVHIGKLKVSESQAVDALTAHSWDYEPKTKCNYHEVKECKYCALGFVNRYAFALSDSVCHLFDVQLTDKHMPLHGDRTSLYTMLPSMSMKVDFNQGDRQPTNRGVPVQSLTNKSVPQRFNQQYQQQQRQVSDDEDSDDKSDSEDEQPKTLRRPNIPVSAFVNPGAVPVGRGNPGLLGGVAQPVPVGRGMTFTGMGRGMPQTLDTDEPKKFAGRANAPAPSTAPPPPVAWQNMNVQNPYTAIQSNPVTQGYPQLQGGQRPVGPNSMYNPTPRVPPGFSPNVPGISEPAGIGITPAHLNGLQPTIPTMPGLIRGRGRGILQSVMSSTKQVPKGRGYAPPGYNAAQMNIEDLSI